MTPSGEVFGVWRREEDGDDALELAKFGADGTADPEFSGGLARLEGEDLSVLEVLLASDGSIWVVGDVGYQPFVTRFAPDGTWDAALGVKVLTEFGTQNVRDAMLDSSDRLYVLGMSSNTPMVARLTGGGELDPSFGYEGIAEIPLGMPLSPDYDEEVSAWAMTIDDEGQVICAGNYRFDEGEDGVYEEKSVFVARLTSAGEPDDTFGEYSVARVTMLPDEAGELRSQLAISTDASRIYIAGLLPRPENSASAVIAIHR